MKEMLSRYELLLAAHNEAKWSPHPNTQVGALLYEVCDDAGILLKGAGAHNSISPRFSDSSDQWVGGRRNVYVEHAERACIYNAARLGIRTEGAGMVATWAACIDCARAMIHAGISEVLTDSESTIRTPPRWADSVLAGRQLLLEAGVKIIIVSGDVSKEVPLRLHLDDPPAST